MVTGLIPPDPYQPHGAVLSGKVVLIKLIWKKMIFFLLQTLVVQQYLRQIWKKFLRMVLITDSTVSFQTRQTRIRSKFSSKFLLKPGFISLSLNFEISFSLLLYKFKKKSYLVITFYRDLSILKRDLKC